MCASAYFREMTSQTEAADLVSVSFFLLLPWRNKCHIQTSGGLVKAWVTAGWVRTTCVCIKCTCVLQHTAYRSCETYVWQRWFTLLLFTEKCSVNHTQSLIWRLSFLRVVTHTHTRLLLHIATIKLLCIYHQQSIIAIRILLLHMTHLLLITVQYNPLYISEQLNKPSLEGKQHIH